MDAWMLILAIIGASAAIFQLITLIATYFKKRKVLAWGQFVKLVKQTIIRMREQSYEPDLIIGCGRGGAVMASILSGNLCNQKGKKECHTPFRTCDRLYEWTPSKSKSVPIRNTCITRLPETDLSGKNILLTISVVSTGDTIVKLIEEILRYSKRKKPSIRVYSIIKYPNSNLIPDYYNIEGEILKMPWEISKEYVHDSKPPSIREYM